jgi:hypothetical protein
MTNADQHRLRERLNEESQKLLETIDDLHALEEQKRDEDISTPPFHRLADTIKAKAQEAFRISTIEENLGDRIERGEVALNDVDPGGDRS